MKQNICQCLIWCLRKLNCSVIIGFKLSKGTLQGTNKYCYYYNNNFDNVEILDKFGSEIEIPHMKPFNFETREK